MATKENLDKKVSLAIRRFVEALKAKGIPIEEVILFGSWARGEATKDSDIDICLISSKFGYDEVAELQFLLKQTREFDDRIEPLPLSLKDFEEDATPLVLEIKKFGRRIIP